MFMTLNLRRGQSFRIRTVSDTSYAKLYGKEDLNEVTYEDLVQNDFKQMFETKVAVQTTLNKDGKVKLKTGRTKGVKLKAKYSRCGFKLAWEKFESNNGTLKMIEPLLDGTQCMMQPEYAKKFSYLKGPEHYKYVVWATTKTIQHLNHRKGLFLLFKIVLYMVKIVLYMVKIVLYMVNIVFVVHSSTV